MAASNINVMRIFADAAGRSHFEDLQVEMASADFAPPAPPLDVSSFTPAARYGFLRAPAGWYGDWHPAPRRQVVFSLSGEVEVEVTDGEVRRVTPGSVVVLEDTKGRGHTTRVVGDEEALFGVVQLEDQG